MMNLCCVKCRGTFSDERHLELHNRIYPNCRKNFAGMTFPVSSVIEHPHVEFRDGRWYVKDSKVPAFRIYTWHRRGTTFETLFKRYPGLGCAKVLSAVAFIYDNPEVIEHEEHYESNWHLPDEQGKLFR